jgi:hypothetical protein
MHTCVIYIYIYIIIFTLTSLRVEPIHPASMYCPTAQSLHAAHTVSLIPYPSHSLYIYWSNSHACEQLRHVTSAVPVPLHCDDARMRMPRPHEAVQGKHVTGVRLPSTAHGPERRWPVQNPETQRVMLCLYDFAQ